MTWLDLAILVLLVIGVVNGVRRGFLLGALDLATIVLALVAGSLLYQPVARTLQGQLNLNRAVASLAGFALIALGVQFATWLLVVTPLRPSIEAARRLPVSRQFDAALGAVPGLVKALVLAATLLLATSLIPLGAGRYAPQDDDSSHGGGPAAGRA